MSSKNPFSAKQSKAQLQDRRALKRGEIEALPIKPKFYRNQPHRSNTNTAAESSSRKLQSKFISVSSEYLNLTRDLAHSEPLLRPIPKEYAEFNLESLVDRDVEGRLTCPGRPKFRYGQSKKEVERNEEGMFKKWLLGVEIIIAVLRIKWKLADSRRQRMMWRNIDGLEVHLGSKLT